MHSDVFLGNLQKWTRTPLIFLNPRSLWVHHLLVLGFTWIEDGGWFQLLWKRYCNSIHFNFCLRQLGENGHSPSSSQIAWPGLNWHIIIYIYMFIYVVIYVVILIYTWLYIHTVYTCVFCCKPPSATWPFSIFRIFQKVVFNLTTLDNKEKQCQRHLRIVKEPKKSTRKMRILIRWRRWQASSYNESTWPTMFDFFCCWRDKKAVQGLQFPKPLG